MILYQFLLSNSIEPRRVVTGDPSSITSPFYFQTELSIRAPANHLPSPDCRYRASVKLLSFVYTLQVAICSLDSEVRRHRHVTILLS